MRLVSRTLGFLCTGDVLKLNFAFDESPKPELLVSLVWCCISVPKEPEWHGALTAELFTLEK